MAKILPFARGRAGRKPVDPKYAGEIVIFPGVRVEYHDGLGEPDPKDRRRRSRRNAEDALSA